MGINILEIKAVLRSILVSSTVVIDVFQLNKDFKEQMGILIPYKDLGYDSLLKFLKSIPDVLMVRGDSCCSQVILVESEKSAHISDLVLRQKISKKPGGFFRTGVATRRGARKGRNNRNDYHPPKPPQIKEPYHEIPKETTIVKNSSHKISSDKSNKSEVLSTNEVTKSHCDVIQKLPEKNSISVDLVKTERLNGEKKILENSPKNVIEENSLSKESTRLLRRIDYKSSTPNFNSSLQINASDSGSLDVSLKASAIQKNTNYWKGGATRISRETTDNHSVEKGTLDNFIGSGFNMASSHKTESNSPDLRHNFSIGKLKQKNKPEKWKSQNIDHSHNGRSRVEKSENLKNKHNFIPKTIQDDLRKVISAFPQGLWCAELPTSYKKLIGHDLDFEKLGYRCLIHLCFDLENIFHCIRESSCDFKLYDVRKPLPEVRDHLDQNIQNQSLEETTAEELTPAMPDLSWEGYSCFLPKDILGLGEKIERLQVAEMLQVGSCVKVVVAEIYDISKFWIHLDDSKLERLMREMQLFYEINNKYVIPKSLLAEDLYCVVLYQSKFHRAVVLNVMPDEDFLKVYYIDYGTLATVSKSEVWFMKRQFSDLPCQAIRARLIDVYPPYEGVTWSPFANYDFSKFTCSKKLTAEISRIDKHKNLVDIKLKNDYGIYISDVLVEDKHASFINKSPKKCIKDPNIESKVKFIHLFPTFDEIENWVVPSNAEATDFLNTPVTADFLYSQYFSRKVDKDLMDNVEKKMKIVSKKTKTLIKFIKPEEFSSSHNIEDMNAIAYGRLYDPSVTVTNAGNDFADKSLEEKCPQQVQTMTDSKNNSWVNIEDDETLARILRQSKMKKSCSFEDEEVQENLNDSKDKLNVDQSRRSSLSGSSKKEGSFIQKSRHKASRKLSNFLELEKYLSEDDSCKDASKKSSPNLIDLDNEYLTSYNPPTNLLLSLEFEQSMLELARSRKKCQNCLLTGTTVSDMENSVMVNPLDLPIPNDLRRFIPTDLIQFDEEETTDSDSKGAIPFINNLVESTELSDADDEDSDSKRKSKNLHDSFYSRAPQKKRQVESTATNAAIEADYYDVSNNEMSLQLTNIPEFTASNSENGHKCATSNVQPSSNQSNIVNQDIFELEDCIINDAGISNEKHTLSNMNLMNSHCDIKTDSTSLGSNQISTEQRCLSTASNTTSLSSNSIVTIDSAEFNNSYISGDSTIENDFNELNEDQSHRKHLNENEDMTNKMNSLSKPSHSVDSTEFVKQEYLEGSAPDLRANTDNIMDPKDDGNMILHESSSSTNLYYSCESKESSIADSVHENILDLSIFDVYDNALDSSTPLPTQNDLNKDSSFLEEFDIIDVSRTLTDDEINEAVSSNLSALSREFINLEKPTSHQEIEDSNSDVEAHVQHDGSDMDIVNSSVSSYKVINKSQLDLVKQDDKPNLPDSSTSTTNLSESPVSSNNMKTPIPALSYPQFPYPMNFMHHPSMIMPRPPPGFPAVPPCGFPSRPPPGFPPMSSHGFTTVLVPNSIHPPNGFVPPNIPMHCIPPQQQQMVNEVAQFYRTQPIVVLNYNFIPPPLNQNGSS